MNPKPLAVQLYSFKDEPNLDAVLERVQQMGYVGIEPYRGNDVDAVARVAQRLGLQIPSAHLSMPLGDDEAPTLRAAERYELEYIVIPAVGRENFESLTRIQRLCERMNKAAQIAEQHGYTLGYHNHGWEMAEIEGKPAIAHMHDHLDDRVVFQIDTYFVHARGLDPAQLIRDFGDRVRLLHLKDGPADDPNGEHAANTAIGDGVLDFPAIVEAATVAKWHVVEIEGTSDVVAATAQSYRYLTENGLSSGR